MSWLQLANKTCIVTGAGSGIGAAVAKALSNAQCHVVMADHNADGMENVLQEIKSSSLDYSSSFHHVVTCDVGNEKQVRDLIQQADSFAETLTCESREESPRVRMLVNCAGITRDNWISKMAEEEWDDVIDVNLKGTYLTCRHFLDQNRVDWLFPKGNDRSVSSGSIVNIGSIVSERGNLGQVNYAASKGGVLGLTRALAKEVAIRNINVNTVIPGFIHSPMSHAVPDHIKERMIHQISVRRFGDPEEVADLVCFLLSPRSSYITGESVTISGMIGL
ncbi:3-oxoacyl-reductase [Nitzschia inconspicua]|uniref:3-oxoacyl-reductase n=1 Tax=Nitzschia inconspicua TaxID=303405 RepID=A0A9K3KZC1_9STRA|nr:3-oxoacyl-reductase [Nitzschia inconspicua]